MGTRRIICLAMFLAVFMALPLAGMSSNGNGFEDSVEKYKSLGNNPKKQDAFLGDMLREELQSMDMSFSSAVRKIWILDKMDELALRTGDENDFFEFSSGIANMFYDKEQKLLYYGLMRKVGNDLVDSGSMSADSLVDMVISFRQAECGELAYLKEVFRFDFLPQGYYPSDIREFACDLVYLYSEQLADSDREQLLLAASGSVAGRDGYADAKYAIALNRLRLGHRPAEALAYIDSCIASAGDDRTVLPYAAEKIELMESMARETDNEDKQYDIIESCYGFAQSVYSRFSGSGSAQELGDLAGIRKFIESCEYRMLDLGMQPGLVSSYPSHSEVVLRLQTRNVDRVEVKVYKLGDMARLVRSLWGQVPDYMKESLDAEYAVSVKDARLGKYCYTDVKINTGEPGRYYAVAKSGEDSTTLDFDVSDILCCLRENQGNTAAYLMNAADGKPYEKAELNTYTATFDMNNVIFRPKVSRKMKFRGFTPVRNLDSSALWINFSSENDTYSRIMMYYRDGRGAVSEDTRTIDALVYTDRPLYGFGTPVGAGAVVYAHDRAAGVSETVSGKPFVLELYNPDGILVDRKSFISDRFGSVYASFNVAEDGNRPGIYRMVLKDGETAITSSLFRIETYYVPDVRIETDGGPYIYGYNDTMVFGGRLVSASGSSMSGAKVGFRAEFHASYNDRIPYEGEMVCDGNGRFSISLPVRDILAEKRFSFRDGVFPEVMSVFLDIWNVEGNRAVAKIVTSVAKKPVVLGLNADTVAAGCVYVKPELYSSGTGMLKGTASLTVDRITEAGPVRAGCIDAVLSAETDITSLFSVSGRYLVSAVSAADGYEAKDSLFVNYVSPDDRNIPEGMEIPLLFYAGGKEIYECGKEIGFKLGTSARNGVNVLVELLDGDNVLKTKSIYVPFGISSFSFDFKSSYPDHVTLSVLTACEGEITEFRKQIVRRHEPDGITVEIQGVERHLLSGGTMDIVLNVRDGKGNPVSAQVMATAYNSSLDRLGETDLAFRSDMFTWNDVPYTRFSTGERYYMNPMRKSVSASDVTDAVAEEDVVREYSTLESDSDTDKTVVDNLRSDMNESLFYSPALETDAEGNVFFRIKGGDLLSEFRLRVLVHTTDMRWNSADTVFTVSKPLSVYSDIPKFFYAGDEAVLTLTGSDHEGLGAGMEFFAEASDDSGCSYACSVEKAGGNGRDGKAVLRIKVPEDAEGKMILRYGVRSSEDPSVYDAVETAVEILPLYDWQYVAEMKYIAPGEKWHFVPDSANRELTVETVTPAHILERTLQSLASDGSPTFVSAMSSYVSGRIARSLNRVKMPDECTFAGVVDLSRFVNADGGMAWIPGLPSSFDMTLFFLEEYAYLENTGIADKGSDRHILEKMKTSAVRFIDRYMAEKDSSEATLLSGEVMRYLAVRKWYGNIGVPSYALDNYSKALSAVKNRNISEAGASELLSVAEVARAYGYADLYRRAIRSLAGYASENDGCIEFPALTGYDGILDSKLAAHIRAYMLFESEGNSRMAEGILRWMLAQGAFYDWGGRAVSLKAASLLWKVSGAEGNGMQFRISDNGGNLKVSSSDEVSHVWEAGCIPEGFDVANTGNVPVVVNVHYSTPVRVDSLKSRCNGISMDGTVAETAMGKSDVRYAVDSPLYADYMVIRGFRSAVFRSIDERSGFVYIRGVKCYRQVGKYGIDYYFEKLPSGVTIIRDQLYRFPDEGRYTVASPTIFRE